MNIWYVSKYASPAKYFFGTRHFYLAEEWVKTGNKATVITSNSSHLSEHLPSFSGYKMEESINGVQSVWFNVIKSKSSGGIRRILSWVQFDFYFLIFGFFRKEKPDVIIVSSLSLTTVIPAYLLSKIYSTKLIFEVRDIWPLSIIKLGGYSENNLFVKVLAWIEKFGYEKANLIVGTMPNLIEHVKNVTQNYKKCICVPQGLSLSFYDNDQEDLSNQYIEEHIPSEKFIIAYAGTVNANNPLQAFVKAARNLKDNSSIHFLVLGNGNQKEQLMSETNDLSNISFPPSVKKSQVNSFLKHVHICYDSFESDLAKYGLSRNKWIDYMFAKKPIFCSFDGYQSMINEASCGSFLKFDDADALALEILKYQQLDPSELKRIGENGYRYLIENRLFPILSARYLEEINNS